MEDTRIKGTVEYVYRNLPISGGGYVTGLTFSMTQPDVLYARTDIGGIYRYDYEKGCWHSLTEAVGPDEIEMTYPLAIAVEGKKLYVACGSWHEKEGLFAVSEDEGDTFCAYTIPARVHGNCPGRGSGRRLVCHENGTMYLATQSKGLLSSPDEGQTWEEVDMADYAHGVKNETNLTFVWCGSGDNDRTIVIGTAGSCNATEAEDISQGKDVPPKPVKRRGHGLYASYDGGITFSRLPMPEYPNNTPGIRGYVPQRYAWDGEWLYVTMNGTGDTGFWGMDGYGNDSARSVNGRIFKYRFGDNRLLETVDVTPKAKVMKKILPKPKGLFAKSPVKLREEAYPFGFGGISACSKKPGLLVTAVIGGMFGPAVLRSFDYGKNWEVILHDLNIGEMHFRTSYMKPEYNGGRLLIHWLHDVQINPFRPSEAWFITGTGVFSTRNLDSPDKVCWQDNCDGLEETVHMNVYALPILRKPDMPVGEKTIHVVDAVGDLGAFIFHRYDEPCENTVADGQNHRYITVLNGDYPDTSPSVLVLSPRGNWTATTKGGVILSKDGGQSWKHLGYPSGLNERTDTLAERIGKPNVNSGWTAISAGGEIILWGMAEGHELPTDAIVRTEDEGKTWSLCSVRQLPRQKNPRLQGVKDEDTAPVMKVMADRVNPKVFYGFGDHFRIYISPDEGKHFYEYPVAGATNLATGEPVEIPNINCGFVEGGNLPEIRGESGAEGVFWIAAREAGLWRMQYERTTDRITLVRITGEGETCYAVGLGIGRNVTERNYLSGQKTIYIAAKLVQDDGTLHYGFWRSDDEGLHWSLINHTRQRYGQIRSIDGDCRVYGRYFIGTGTMGILMGEEAKKQSDEKEA